MVTALVDDAQCNAALGSHLHTGFVPVLAAALDRLASGEPDPEMLACTCEVLAFYLLHTPSKATAGGKLLSSGALRALSQLFVRHALQHDAEALRYCKGCEYGAASRMTHCMIWAYHTLFPRTGAARCLQLRHPQSRVTGLCRSPPCQTLPWGRCLRSTSWWRGTGWRGLRCLGSHRRGGGLGRWLGGWWRAIVPDSHWRYVTMH